MISQQLREVCECVKYCQPLLLCCLDTAGSSSLHTAPGRRSESETNVASIINNSIVLAFSPDAMKTSSKCNADLQIRNERSCWKLPPYIKFDNNFKDIWATYSVTNTRFFFSSIKMIHKTQSGFGIQYLSITFDKIIDS